jgi:hypothetical protein
MGKHVCGHPAPAPAPGTTLVVADLTPIQGLLGGLMSALGGGGGQNRHRRTRERGWPWLDGPKQDERGCRCAVNELRPQRTFRGLATDGGRETLAYKIPGEIPSCSAH